MFKLPNKIQGHEFDIQIKMNKKKDKALSITFTYWGNKQSGVQPVIEKYSSPNFLNCHFSDLKIKTNDSQENVVLISKEDCKKIYTALDQIDFGIDLQSSSTDIRALNKAFHFCHDGYYSKEESERKSFPYGFTLNIEHYDAISSKCAVIREKLKNEKSSQGKSLLKYIPAFYRECNRLYPYKRMLEDQETFEKSGAFFTFPQESKGKTE